MRELVANEVRELWSYREHWLGLVTATESATPLDVVGWVLANCGSDDPYAALAFFEAGVRSGAISRMFKKSYTAEWQRNIEIILMELRRNNGKINLSQMRESLTLQETMYLGLLSSVH